MQAACRVSTLLLNSEEVVRVVVDPRVLKPGPQAVNDFQYYGFEVSQRTKQQPVNLDLSEESFHLVSKCRYAYSDMGDC